MDLPKFQIISAANCLDHAYDVPLGLDELVRSLAEQGVIQLMHWENEGKAQHYLGMHQWNIEIKDERIHIWNKERSHLFDHESNGLSLKYYRQVVNKGTGVPHPKIPIKLSRGLH
ncbi:MAG: hypothetical protein ABJZ84_08395 [Paracoccaceae bacterium]